MEKKELEKLAKEYVKELTEYVKKGKIYEYFEEVVTLHDIIFVVDKDGWIRGIRACVVAGGPNVYIDTFKDKVIALWLGMGTALIEPCISEVITEYFRDIYKFKRDEF